MDMFSLIIRGLSLFDINLYEFIISFIKSAINLITG